MENTSGFCKQIIKASGTVLLEINQDNFEVINKLQKCSCTKMVIGDYIVWDNVEEIQILFSKDLKNKSSRRKTVNNYKINKEKTQISTSWLGREKISYLVITSQSEINVLKLYGCTLNLEIGNIALFGPWQELEVVTKENFILNYKVCKK